MAPCDLTWAQYYELELICQVRGVRRLEIVGSVKKRIVQAAADMPLPVPRLPGYGLSDLAAEVSSKLWLSVDIAPLDEVDRTLPWIVVYPSADYPPPLPPSETDISSTS